jgi:hypothetical protein
MQKNHNKNLSSKNKSTARFPYAPSAVIQHSHIYTSITISMYGK